MKAKPAEARYFAICHAAKKRIENEISKLTPSIASKTAFYRRNQSRRKRPVFSIRKYRPSMSSSENQALALADPSVLRMRGRYERAAGPLHHVALSSTS